MEERLTNVDERTKKTDQKVDEILNRLDTKYAAKWSEQAMKFVIVLIMGAFFAALINLVIRDTSNNPTSSQTTTTTTPTGSTSTTNTRDGTPPSANAQAQSTSDKPTDSQPSTNPVKEVLNVLPLGR